VWTQRRHETSLGVTKLAEFALMRTETREPPISRHDGGQTADHIELAPKVVEELRPP
jgi:hypothetical protein